MSDLYWTELINIYAGYTVDTLVGAVTHLSQPFHWAHLGWGRAGFRRRQVKRYQWPRDTRESTTVEVRTAASDSATARGSLSPLGRPSVLYYCSIQSTSQARALLSSLLVAAHGYSSGSR